MLGDDNSSPNPHIDDSKDSLAPDTEQSKAPPAQAPPRPYGEEK